VYHVPVAGAGDDNLPVQKILVHLIQGRGRPGASGRNHCRSGLEGKGILFPVRAGEEGAIHKAHQRAIHPGEVHRRTDYYTVNWLLSPTVTCR